MNDFRSRIAEGLKSLRLQKNYSQEYIAEKLGKSDYTGYQRIESGRTELKFEDAYKLADIYNVPMEKIYNPDLNESSTFSEGSVAPYGKREVLHLNIYLDGTETQLDKQIELLKRVNSCITSD
ncbi:helix-turn-helix domain-containing protein [Mongoliibacter ruber]|uniref:DNA-binding XRE family transcriptional regulator n=1 Tax=Mongoliibacter ruber TaxID=1750599 RepID=A0A2T0WVA8_9BACT|nr:helix-turn-helix transcriptional regulator [Mongoliibacter ruber]PRY90626.1 DNA-binding XRE family transcriptional regulator [Mongoliibacter ruber]